MGCDLELAISRPFLGRFDGTRLIGKPVAPSFKSAYNCNSNCVHNVVIDNTVKWLRLNVFLLKLIILEKKWYVIEIIIRIVIIITTVI